MKECIICHQLKEYSEFYKHPKTKDGYNSSCKVCQYEKYNKVHIKKRKELKLHYVELLGGKCSKCGYNKHPEILEFHHLDPKEKDFSVSNLLRMGKQADNEILKCILLCPNCHKEEHYHNNYKLNKKPITTPPADGYKMCSSCHELKPLNEFSSHPSSKDKHHSKCRECFNRMNKEKRTSNIRHLTEMFGGKCSRCGYDKCIGALSFHHKDPSTKEYQISDISDRNIENIMNEANKCELLCENCHREEHIIL